MAESLSAGPEAGPETEEQLVLRPHVCMAELMSAAPIVLAKATRDAIVADLRDSLGGIQVLRSDAETLHLALEGHPVHYESGETVPAQVLFLSAASPNLNPDPEKAAETLEASLAQTWSWEGAREAAAGAPHTLLVSDFLATGLEPEQRLNIFPKIVAAAAKHVPCAALHFPGSQFLISPDAFLAASPGDEDYYPLLGLVNVRLFSVRDTEDEFVMDSLGLNVFGLPDVQCHCSGGDPGDIGAWLYSLAAHVAETDREITDGDTVEAFDGNIMRLRYEESLVPPRRVVLDVRAASDEEDQL